MDDFRLVQFVPRNLGRDDEGAEEDVLEFEFRHGLGARIIEDDMERSIAIGELDGDTHPMHLLKKDFEKSGDTDPCPGCSTLLRGMKQQPHSEACRKRMREMFGVRLKTQAHQ